MTTTDHDLLRQYIGGSDEAFAELVRRHLDLVFSAARRQTRSPTQAEEVAQSVFIHLARDARRIAPGAPLPAWLHLVTRHTAMDVAKMEERRRAREQVAFEISAMNSSPPEWTRIEPLLDEAVAALAPADRAAVLLRYFDGKSLREVGRGLGTSEEAARKRVGRALEQLRSFFLKRGVAVTAATLATHLPAQAVQAAPAGLCATISTVATLSGTALQPPIVAAATTLAMTTLQKAFATVALAAVIAGGWYESRVVSRQNNEILALQKQSADLKAQGEKADRERAQAGALESARAAANAVGAGQPAQAAATFANANAQPLAAKARRLRELFDAMPARKIPELGLLTDDDWNKGVENLSLDTDTQIRAAFLKMRNAAKDKLAPLMSQAIREYKDANNGSPPSDVSQLASYFHPPIDRAVLDRYAPSATETLNPFTRQPDFTVAEKRSAVVDPDFDSRYQVSESGDKVNSISESGDVFRDAMKQFSVANGGAKPTSAEALLPFLATPIDPVLLQEFFITSPPLRFSSQGVFPPPGLRSSTGGSPGAMISSRGGSAVGASSRQNEPGEPGTPQLSVSGGQ